MEEITWSAEMSLGVPEMDTSHQEILVDLSRMTRLSDEEFGAEFPTWTAKVERDFYSEERLMDEINFPAVKSHVEQHARVLSALHHAEPRVAEGDIAHGRRVVGLLPQWFVFHISTMDMALAAAVQIHEAQLIAATSHPGKQG